MQETLGLFIALAIISNIFIWRLQQVAVNNPVTITAKPRLAVLSYAPALRTSCWFLMLGLMLLAAATLHRYGDNLQEVRLFYSCVVVLLGSSILLLIEVKTRRVMLTDEAIASFGRLGRKAVRWSDVESIQFNRYLRMITIHSIGGKCLRVNPSLSGMEFLEFMASEKLDSASYLPAFRALAKYLPTRKLSD